MINDKDLSYKISEDYKNIFRDEEVTGRITDKIIKKALQILQFVPKERKHKFELKDKELFKKVSGEDIEADRYDGGADSIQNNLSGWVKDVFNVLNGINLDVFKLDDVYKHENKLKSLHPRNQYVRDKIRQQLQVLRDLGLLQFVDRGVYRKLWI